MLRFKTYLQLNFKTALAFVMFMTVLIPINATTSYSQSERISLDVENVALSDLISEIESLTDFKFLYNRKDLDLNMKVSVKLKKRRISSILNKTLKGTNLDFRVMNKQIVLTSKPTPPLKLQIAITGTVTDETGQPLPGATIIEQGTSNGTQSDFDGNFNIVVNSQDATLVISYVGYLSQNVIVGDQTTVNVILSEDLSGLNEVVLVGYGTELKRNLTSSVATVSSENLQEIPATSLSNILAGRVTGARISTQGGRPGTRSNIIIRGATTGGFAGSNQPLYVIDNVVASKEAFDLLDINEVENVTFLKDAAAGAVYGSRASNGVILVTTKSGKPGKARLEFTSSLSSSDYALQTEHLSSYEHAILINRSYRANDEPGIPGRLPDNQFINDQELQYLKENDWGSFEEQSEVVPVTRRYAANITGGSNEVDYFVAGSFIDEEGKFESLNYQKHNLRANLGVNIAKNLRLSFNTDFSGDRNDQYYWPFDGNLFTIRDSYRQGTRRGNWLPAFLNGLPVGNFNAFNVSDMVENEGFGSRINISNIANYIIDLTYKVPFVDGLNAGVSYNNRIINRKGTIFTKPDTKYLFQADPNNRFALDPNSEPTPRTFRRRGANSRSISKNTSRDQSYQLNFKLDYANTFGDHTFSALFVYEQWEFKTESTNAFRRNPISDNVRELYATPPAREVGDQQSGGSSGESGRLSYIGNLGYSYLDKYFINGTFRYDGSVEFLPGQQYGFFPSLSAAWIASDESFFGDGFGAIDFLKLRVSWGRTGNDDLNPNTLVPTFPYLGGYGISGAGYVFGNTNQTSLNLFSTGLPSVNFTWDQTDSYNIALDGELFDFKLSATIEAFLNKRSNLFGSRTNTTPVILGTSLPRVNYGAIDVKGIELILNYKNQIAQDFKFDLGFNFGYAQNKVVEFDENDAQLDIRKQTGTNTGRLFGFETIGIIRSQAEVDALIAAGFKQNNRDPFLGMLLHRDIRGTLTDDPEGNTPDGKVDGNDITLIAQNSVAPINYGVSLRLDYKNFSVDAFIQGFEGHKKFVPDSGKFPFDAISEAGWSHWNDAYDPIDNPNGAFPRFSGRTFWSYYGFDNSQFWLRDGGFARLKNLNIAYRLPQNLMDSLGISQAKLFFNGTNLLFIYKGTTMFDPEIQGEGIPINKSYSLGLQLTI